MQNMQWLAMAIIPPSFLRLSLGLILLKLFLFVLFLFKANSSIRNQT